MLAASPVPASIDPSMTVEAPAANARAASPAPLIPPSAMTGRSTFLSTRAVVTSATAKSVGAPARVTSEVMQMEPDPIPALNPSTLGSSSSMSKTACLVPTLPATKSELNSGRSFRDSSITLELWKWATSATRKSTDRPTPCTSPCRGEKLTLRQGAFPGRLCFSPPPWTSSPA